MRIKKAFWPLMIFTGFVLLEYFLVTTGEARNAIKSYLREEGNPDALEKVDLMSRREVMDLFQFIFEYSIPGIELPFSHPLFKRIIALGAKYDILN